MKYKEFLKECTVKKVSISGKDNFVLQSAEVNYGCSKDDKTTVRLVFKEIDVHPVVNNLIFIDAPELFFRTEILLWEQIKKGHPLKIFEIEFIENYGKEKKTLKNKQ
jgi:hypothetical protein